MVAVKEVVNLLHTVRKRRELFLRFAKKRLEELELRVVCPLTFEVMKNPVKLSDGFTYERGAIHDWLAYKSISPMTKEKLHNKEFVLDIEVKECINEYISIQRKLVNYTDS